MIKDRLRWAGKKGSFMRAYGANCKQTNAIERESSVLIESLLTLVGVQTPQGDVSEGVVLWEGTPTGLLEVLSHHASPVLTRSPGWPKAPNALSSAMDRLGPHLKELGMETRRSRSNATRSIQIVKLPGKGGEPSSPSSPSSRDDAEATEVLARANQNGYLKVFAGKNLSAQTDGKLAALYLGSIVERPAGDPAR